MKSDRLNQSKKAMKKSMRYLSMTILALMVVVITGCSSDENSIEEPKQPENDKVVTLTATVSMDGSATTRALTKDGVKTFAAGETMAVVYKNTDGATAVATSKPLDGSGDIDDGGKNATFTFTLEDPDKTKDVTYVYPAAMVNADGTINYDALDSQDGTLSTIASSLDYCTNSGVWNNGALPTLTLENRLAICAYTIKNSDGTSDKNSDMTGSVTDMTINDGANIYTVSRSAAAGPIYVAIRPTSGANISYTATVGAYVYEKSVTAKTYEAGNLYPLGLRMTKADGLLIGKFTINISGDQVRFSQGNLQAVCASADNDGNTQESWTWKFATNQWDYVGDAAANNAVNGNGSVSVAGTVDLFGWVGASNTTWTGNAQYGICNSKENSDYGTSTSDALKSDWGKTIGSGWRTLTITEWEYLFNERASGSTVNGTSNARYTYATINNGGTGVEGMILFPDGVTITNSEATWGTINGAGTNCTSAQWTALEGKGCVFLPAAGYRWGAEVYGAYSKALYYWSSSPHTSIVGDAYDVCFYQSQFPQNYNQRSYGFSVRLVRDVK